MAILMHRLLSVCAATWLGMQILGCAQGDIVLGTGADPLPQPATGPDVPLAAAIAAAGAGGPKQPPMLAANGFRQSPPAAGSAMHAQPAGPGQAPAASTAPPARPPFRDADAGPPRPSTRQSSGCGTDPMPLGVVVNGQTASFLLDVPASYDKMRPYRVVLAFHGMDSSADEFRSQLNLASIADAIIMYPNPMDIGWQFQPDSTLADALLSQLGQSNSVGLDHVFAMGDGAGALFANLLGCVRGDQIRAIATFSNTPPPPGPCGGNTAVWLLQRNDADPMTVASGLGTRDFWTRVNACDPRMPKPVSPSPCLEYRGCSPGQPVRFCEYSGTQWPSFAVSGAWEFFESF